MKVQYSVRTFLVAAMILGFVFGVIGIIWRNGRPPSKVEIEAINTIESSSWVTVTETRTFLNEVVFVVGVHVRCPDADSEVAGISDQLYQLRRVRLELAGTNFSDKGAKLLLQLPTTREVFLTDTDVSPAGLDWIRRHAKHCDIVEYSVHGTIP